MAKQLKSEVKEGIYFPLCPHCHGQRKMWTPNGVKPCHVCHGDGTVYGTIQTFKK